MGRLPMTTEANVKSVPKYEENERVIASPYQSMALKVAIAAIMAALTTVTTSLIQIYIPATNGYFNLGEVVIFVSALIFGPYVGAFAGGVGAALADALSPYIIYAPGTLIAKGLEGFIVGYIYFKIKTKDKFFSNLLLKLVAIIPGGLVMVLTYLGYEYFILQYYGAAFGEVPFNLMQMGIGLAAAIPISLPLEQLNLEVIGLPKLK